jgi:PPOX class probable FMN-dependent enzyme
VDVVTSVEQLEALYAAPVETSLLKVTDHITPLQQRYVDESPFVILATVGGEGVDCSPRGDPAGFVRVVDRRTVQIPDRRGNNRLDSLRNIVRDGRVALLFVINGTAVLRTDADVRASFEIDGKQPATVIEVAVTECYTQCPKALIRSDLWNAEHFRSATDLPTVGEINSEISNGAFDGAAYDAAYPERVKQTIY